MPSITSPPMNTSNRVSHHQPANEFAAHHPVRLRNGNNGLVGLRSGHHTQLSHAPPPRSSRSRIGRSPTCDRADCRPDRPRTRRLPPFSPFRPPRRHCSSPAGRHAEDGCTALPPGIGYDPAHWNRSPTAWRRWMTGLCRRPAPLRHWPLSGDTDLQKTEVISRHPCIAPQCAVASVADFRFAARWPVEVRTAPPRAPATCAGPHLRLWFG
jgi:hypothetical protein